MANARHHSAAQPADTQTDWAPATAPKGRVSSDRLPVSEFLFDRAGAPAPFGDDQELPLPISALTYRHPGGGH